MAKSAQQSSAGTWATLGGSFSSPEQRSPEETLGQKGQPARCMWPWSVASLSILTLNISGKRSSVCLCQKPAQHSHAELAFYFYPAIQVLPSRTPTITRQPLKFSLTLLSSTTQCSIPSISPYRITALLWARRPPSLLKHPHLSVTLQTWCQLDTVY